VSVASYLDAIKSLIFRELGRSVSLLSAACRRLGDLADSRILRFRRTCFGRVRSLLLKDYLCKSAAAPQAPGNYCFGNRVELNGIEPMTSGMQSPRSPS
jgi:hypothetical protein